MFPTVNLTGTVREIYKKSEMKNNAQRQLMIFDMFVFKPYWDNSKEQRKTLYVKVLLSGSVNSSKWDYIEKGKRIAFGATPFSIVDYNGKQTFTLSANLNNIEILDSFSSGNNNNYDNNQNYQNNQSYQNDNTNNYNYNQQENNENDGWVNNMDSNFAKDPFGSIEDDIEQKKTSMPQKSDDKYLNEVESVIGNPYS